MGVSNLYSLPYLGIKDGLHKYQFYAGNDFFSAFEHSPIEQGDFEIHVEVDKRGNLSEFVFHITGKAKAICDRCLADIKLPVSGNYVLHGRLSEEDVDDEEIITIKPDQSHIDLSQHIYEMICISMPLTNVYDCENEIPKVCDEAVLSKLAPDSGPKDVEIQDSNVWQNLKGLIEDN
jgi:uncharacterized protein